MKYERFEELPVWKLAMEIVLRIYELTRDRFFFAAWRFARPDTARQSVDFQQYRRRIRARQHLRTAGLSLYCPRVGWRGTVDAVFYRRKPGSRPFEISDFRSQIIRRNVLAPDTRLGGQSAEQRYPGAAAFDGSVQGDLPRQAAGGKFRSVYR
jgi:hypothetical protein